MKLFIWSLIVADCIRTRFEQTKKIYAMRHEFMLKAAMKEPYDSEFDEVINFHGDDFGEVNLKL